MTWEPKNKLDDEDVDVSDDDDKDKDDDKHGETEKVENWRWFIPLSELSSSGGFIYDVRTEEDQEGVKFMQLLQINTNL